MKLSMLFFVGTLTLATLSCSSVKVVTDANNLTDFSRYETFSFMSWQNVDEELFSEADKKLIKDAFIHQFERRGYTSVSSQGDMQVSVYLVTGEETAFSGYNDYVGGRSGSYSHYRGGWGYGYNGNTSKQRSKLMGTLILNVYDGKNNQIWQAIATGAVNTNPKNREKTIPGKVSSVMRRFPVRPE
jgi:hypothetical protein